MYNRINYLRRDVALYIAETFPLSLTDRERGRVKNVLWDRDMRSQYGRAAPGEEVELDVPETISDHFIWFNDYRKSRLLSRRRE